MDFKEVFRGISDKLMSDFKISAQITHGTDKGTYREDALRRFLEDGHLPQKYTLGHGQIITRKNEVSKSVDLVVYDHLENSPLLYNDSTQIFPIEAIYGIIECKSKLSKEKLVEALENIKSVKGIAPDDVAIHRSGNMLSGYKRPQPFGIVFAYSLADNSLDSLTENLKAWESENDPSVWPNLVVILNEGIIVHRDGFFHNRTKNGDIDRSSTPWSLEIKENALFRFYTIFMDLCTNMQLGRFSLEEYFDLPDRFDDIYVKGNDRFRDKATGKKSRIRPEVLRAINEYCTDSRKSTQDEVFRKMTGSVPAGLGDFVPNTEAYLYNPRNLPGQHEVAEPYKMVDGMPEFSKEICFPFMQLVINDKLVFIPYAYITDEVFEIVE